jgi:hypothetical protein
VNIASLRLLSHVVEISRSGLYQDELERVTVSVEGAEPLYAELRLPNTMRWRIGQKVVVMIMAASAETEWRVAA